MKKLIISGLLAITSVAWAQTVVKVEDAWVRGTVASQKATGAFMRLTALSDVRLVAAESDVAAVVEVHEMAMENNVMKMRQIPGLDLPAGRTVELKPGGYHVMLIDLKQPLKAGESVPITLVFEDAAKQRFTQQVTAPVNALGKAAAPMKHDAGAHKR
ncbi:MAG: copper chaperone PCu(A)C [Burkholderiaceae bacterium]